MVRVGVAERLPRSVLLGRDVPATFRLLQPTKCSVDSFVMTRAQARKEQQGAVQLAMKMLAQPTPVTGGNRGEDTGNEPGTSDQAVEFDALDDELFQGRDTHGDSQAQKSRRQRRREKQAGTQRLWAEGATTSIHGGGDDEVAGGKPNQGLRDHEGERNSERQARRILAGRESRRGNRQILL